VSRAGLVLLSLMWALSAQGGVLYTGTSTPGSQGWLGPLAGTETLDPNGFVTLDTTLDSSVQGGYGLIEPLLQSSPGFTLSFTARIDGETHDNGDRAGFSLIVTDGAKHGIEVGFWGSMIWPQKVGFSRDQTKQVEFDTSAMTTYSLTVIGGHYKLTAGNRTLLAGDTVFYDAPGLLGGDFPYRTPHVLFFGDDTSSASARFALQSVELTVVPEPGTVGFLCAGIVLIAWGLRRSASAAV
jgi:hypothetical protein